MTRGKHGAASAGRRAEQAEVALADLRSKTDARIAELTEEVRTLRAENQQLAGSLLSRARELAASDVAQIRDSHAAATKAAEDACADRLRAAFKIISDDPAFRINLDLLPRVAEELGLTPLDLVPGLQTNRDSRRNLRSAKRVRLVNEYHRQVTS